MDDELYFPPGAAGGNHHPAAPIFRPITRAESTRFGGVSFDDRAAGNLAGSFSEISFRPARVPQEDGQAGIMSLQGFLQVRGVLRVEDRDGAHVRSCQKPAQS